MRLLLLSTTLFAAMAAAQSFEAGAFGGVSRVNGKDLGTFSVGDTDRIMLKDGWCFGGRMTINNWSHFGHEVGYRYTRTAFELQGSSTGTAVHQGFYDFLAYATPEGSRVRPFVAGGVQFSNFIYPGLTVSQGGGSNKLGYNYGGGLKVKVSSRYLIRFDVRQYVQGKPFDFPGQSGKVSLLEVSAGFSIHL